jgi:Fic family protein
MKWNWQQQAWPRFVWSATRLARAEERFLVGGGELLGAIRHLDAEGRERLAVDGMSEEAATTSEIEGEVLDRDSVQSSIRRQLGLRTDARRAGPAEHGIAEMMVALQRTFPESLDERTLASWHEMVMRGRRDLQHVGGYRTHAEPMQVLSGRIGEPTVHFEAPPSSRVPQEMSAFLDWFNRTGPAGPEPLPALTRAGVAHIYFESIHPFEDGNGRIGRAISEKALAQSLGGPGLTALSRTILARRRAYYDSLEANNKQVDIEAWLVWFAGIALESQQRRQAQVAFLIDERELLASLQGALNARQERGLRGVLAEGPEGFRGGLSAGNYVAITQASPATARRDLADLVQRGAFARTGERRHARYHLTIPLRPVTPVTIDAAGTVTGMTTLE